MISGIRYISNFKKDSQDIFKYLESNIPWQNEMKSRKTASFGIPYNSSNIKYNYNPIPPELVNLFKEVCEIVGFIPNNVLLNFYETGFSRMGYHSDDINILEKNTGVVILSFGSSRVMRFKSKRSGEIFDQTITPGSLLLLTEENQIEYLHSILPSENILDKRISVTLRKINSINIL